MNIKTINTTMYKVYNTSINLSRFIILCAPESIIDPHIVSITPDSPIFGLYQVFSR